MVNEKHYYKLIIDGYINHIGYGYGYPEITEEEYLEIKKILLSAPEEEGYIYQLKENLDWEVVKASETAHNDNIDATGEGVC